MEHLCKGCGKQFEGDVCPECGLSFGQEPARNVYEGEWKDDKIGGRGV